MLLSWRVSAAVVSALRQGGQSKLIWLSKDVQARQAFCSATFDKLDDNDGNVILATSIERELHQIINQLLRINGFAQYGLDVGITSHIPETIGAEQELIARE